MAERYTILEWNRRFPKTDDPKEIERRRDLFDEREEQLDLVKPGLITYVVRNRNLNKLCYRTAIDASSAVSALGWNLLDCRTLPIEVGKEREPMPEEVKEILRQKNEEKKAEQNKDKPKKEKGPTLKSEMEALFQQHPAGTKEDMIPMLFAILRQRNPDKDDAHLKKRAVLCYHFYKQATKSD